MTPTSGTSVVARWGRWGLAFVVGWCITSVGACVVPPPPTLVLSTKTGDPVTIETIGPILNNTSLTQAQKRQQLLDLGVPSSVVDTLLQAS